MRQALPEIPALAVPCGQDSFSRIWEARACSQQELTKTAACGASFGFAWQRTFWSDDYTSFREQFSHIENRGIDPPKNTLTRATDVFESKGPKRRLVRSRDEADCETAPERRSALAFVFGSQICLFTLSEALPQPQQGYGLRFLQSKWKRKSCQAPVFLPVFLRIASLVRGS